MTDLMTTVREVGLLVGLTVGKQLGDVVGAAVAFIPTSVTVSVGLPLVGDIDVGTDVVGLDDSMTVGEVLGDEVGIPVEGVVDGLNDDGETVGEYDGESVGDIVGVGVVGVCDGVCVVGTVGAPVGDTLDMTGESSM